MKQRTKVTSERERERERRREIKASAEIATALCALYSSVGQLGPRSVRAKPQFERNKRRGRRRRLAEPAKDGRRNPHTVQPPPQIKRSDPEAGPEDPPALPLLQPVLRLLLPLPTPPPPPPTPPPPPPRHVYRLRESRLVATLCLENTWPSPLIA